MESEILTQPPLEKTSLPRLAWWIIAIATGFGLLGSWLLNAKWGLNIALWMMAFVAVLLWFVQRFSLPQQTRWLWGFALVFAGFFVWHNSSSLRFYNSMALWIALGLGFAFAKPGLRGTGFFALLLAWCESLLQTLFGWIPFLLQDFPWQKISLPNLQRYLPIARGLLITVPLLLVFAAMLSSADAAFSALLQKVFSLSIPNADELLWWLIRFAFIAGTVLGVIRLMVLGHKTVYLQTPMQIGVTELSMALGALNFLFATFILIQLGYFFGGQSQITALTGLTYADYARKGFNELLQVVALAFPVLIVALHCSTADARATRNVRWLSYITLVLLGIMLFSSWQRLALYRQAYGLTEIRFYTAVVLIWFFCILIWYAISALQARYSSFVLGVLLSGFLTLGVVNFLNPNAYIVRYNLAQKTEFDLEYALTLGTDAIAPLLEYSQFSPLQQKQLEAAHKEMMLNPSGWDWRSWNWSVAQAIALYK